MKVIFDHHNLRNLNSLSINDPEAEPTEIEVQENTILFHVEVLLEPEGQVEGLATTEDGLGIRLVVHKVVLDGLVVLGIVLDVPVSAVDVVSGRRSWDGRKEARSVFSPQISVLYNLGQD